jgi:hypothetical protein
MELGQGLNCLTISLQLWAIVRTYCDLLPIVEVDYPLLHDIVAPASTKTSMDRIVWTSKLLG